MSQCMMKARRRPTPADRRPRTTRSSYWAKRPALVNEWRGWCARRRRTPAPRRWFSGPRSDVTARDLEEARHIGAELRARVAFQGSPAEEAQPSPLSPIADTAHVRHACRGRPRSQFAKVQMLGLVVDPTFLKPAALLAEEGTQRLQELFGRSCWGRWWQRRGSRAGRAANRRELVLNAAARSDPCDTIRGGRTAGGRSV